CMQAIEYPLTF
nr:immunoglobulin light chain junction region [Macaca mulatta]MOX53034.1 immunoglobulin light chain junction region [Macaca mulatta]MOX56285.1 immunoglobulin light chain junction region [Macaca mulatta]MOX56568.1 immunoglobulin light chain junction region [Macaca mulatta]MOX56784.1 immunoglobulin light chain junction region [Macaca mulatta]